MINRNKKSGPETHKHNRAHPISFTEEVDFYEGCPVYVAIPVKHDNCDLTLTLPGCNSPIVCGCSDTIQVPTKKDIENVINSQPDQDRFRVSDFLNDNIEVGQLWDPLLNLLDNYIEFCDQQLLNNRLKKQRNVNIKVDWMKTKNTLQTLYDSWMALMNQIVNKNDTMFKETRNLVFKTSQLLFNLTNQGISSGCLMNKDQPLIIAWMGACNALASIGNYAHALIKYNNSGYQATKCEKLETILDVYWTRFSDLVKKNKTQIYRDVKQALSDCQRQLSCFLDAPHFIDAIKKYFSKPTKRRALMLIQETSDIISTSLRLLDFKREALEFIFI